MSHDKIYYHTYDIGIQLGMNSYYSAQLYYPEQLASMETEEDALELMTEIWLYDSMVIKVKYPQLEESILRKGWCDGFLDALFPLRHLA